MRGGRKERAGERKLTLVFAFVSSRFCLLTVIRSSGTSVSTWSLFGPSVSSLFMLKLAL